jgi:hypothetical protein
MGAVSETVKPFLASKVKAWGIWDSKDIHFVHKLVFFAQNYLVGLGK